MMAVGVGNPLRRTIHANIPIHKPSPSLPTGHIPRQPAGRELRSLPQGRVTVPGRAPHHRLLARPRRRAGHPAPDAQSLQN